jgi:hypothetical protein
MKEKLQPIGVEGARIESARGQWNERDRNRDRDRETAAEKEVMAVEIGGQEQARNQYLASAEPQKNKVGLIAAQRMAIASPLRAKRQNGGGGGGHIGRDGGLLNQLYYNPDMSFMGGDDGDGGEEEEVHEIDEEEFADEDLEPKEYVERKEYAKEAITQGKKTQLGNNFGLLSLDEENPPIRAPARKYYPPDFDASLLPRASKPAFAPINRVVKLPEGSVRY